MSSRGDGPRRPVAILLGYNLPWLLWTLAALAIAAGSGGVPGPCLTARWLGWCPGCGLTREYAQFLRGEGLPGAWAGAILAGFVLNAAVSLWKAHRVAARGRGGMEDRGWRLSRSRDPSYPAERRD
ncbi:MAG: hypothetical protein WD069_12730 [Planctomycetales bacterium]